MSRPVLVSGPSAFGRETTCVLEPVRESGIHVKLPTGDTVPLSDMTLGVNRLLHFLTLRWKRFILRIPEHLLGLIFNLGLDGVLITPRTFCLPYDGRAKIFWDAIRPVLRPSGTLSGSPCRRPWPLPGRRTATSRLSPPSPAAAASRSTSMSAIRNSAR